ncbi:unnamed protein product [Nezara viridula]|uniref:Uncharacterized protein n=1 Tax=Nezara viridula TaxID=85310 RepID=A0A9P0HEN9_NEZVI|nr:unnamed protein product [Nezara viridula]
MFDGYESLTLNKCLEPILEATFGLPRPIKWTTDANKAKEAAKTMRAWAAEAKSSPSSGEIGRPSPRTNWTSWRRSSTRVTTPASPPGRGWLPRHVCPKPGSR